MIGCNLVGPFPDFYEMLNQDQLCPNSVNYSADMELCLILLSNVTHVKLSALILYLRSRIKMVGGGACATHTTVILLTLCIVIVMFKVVL